MDLDHERIALGRVVGVSAAAVAAGAGRERNQQISLGKKFDEIVGPNGTCFHEVLMRVTRIASAHEYVHHVVNKPQLLRAAASAPPRGPGSNSSDSSGGIPSP